MSLLNAITLTEINKIFPNTELKREYLRLLSQEKPINTNNLRRIVDINNVIIDTWEYHISKRIIRDIFTRTDKYIKNRNAKNKIDELILDWNNLGLGDFEWPFSAMRFDQHVHILNRKDISEQEKDEILAGEVIKFRRIKEINALRNDYIEYLIFNNCEDIIPTLSNSKGVDFYINGEPFDQKVARSVSRPFIETYGEDYKEVAIQHPELVAEILYKYQDEERFGYEPRLLIVYIDSDLTNEDIENSLQNVNFNNPMEISFEYEHLDGRVMSYETYCYIILLHN